MAAQTNTLLEQEDTVYHLGISEMDKTHDEFIDLVNRLSRASSDDFQGLFQELLEHTTQHFAREKELMEDSCFPALAEHVAEHQRVLGELDRFNSRVRSGIFMFARAYINEQIPSWFKLHLATMDSALAAHLNNSNRFLTK